MRNASVFLVLFKITVLIVLYVINVIFALNFSILKNKQLNVCLVNLLFVKNAHKLLSTVSVLFASIVNKITYLFKENAQIVQNIVLKLIQLVNVYSLMK